MKSNGSSSFLWSVHSYGLSLEHVRSTQEGTYLGPTSWGSCLVIVFQTDTNSVSDSLVPLSSSPTPIHVPCQTHGLESPSAGAFTGHAVIINRQLYLAQSVLLLTFTRGEWGNYQPTHGRAGINQALCKNPKVGHTRLALYNNKMYIWYIIYK